MLESCPWCGAKDNLEPVGAMLGNRHCMTKVCRLCKERDGKRFESHCRMNENMLSPSTGFVPTRRRLDESSNS